MLKFERRHQTLLKPEHFVLRLAGFTLFAALLVLASLWLGMAGFHYLEGLGWLDSLLNASMLLGGMGPVDLPKTEAGKYFASFYALFSGMVFLVAFSLLVTPIAHRIFHAFHMPEEEALRPLQRTRKNGFTHRK